MLETGEARLRREADSMARLLAEVRADPLVRPPVARSDHFATVFSNASGSVHRASCRCGWKGNRYALAGERPFANWRVNSARSKAWSEADAHNHGRDSADGEADRP